MEKSVKTSTKKGKGGVREKNDDAHEEQPILTECQEWLQCLTCISFHHSNPMQLV